MRLKNYKTIIFDLGGVLLNINYQATADAFIELGVPDFDSIYTQAQQSHLFDRFEKGEISSLIFRDELRRLTGVSISDHNLDAAWNKMLLDFPIERYFMLKKLSQDHTLILMSNTNQIHIDKFKQIMEKSFGFNRFEALFTAVYYSSDIGKRKPDARTFEWIIKENNLDIKDCIFIDDSIQHIEGAQSIGLDTYHLKSGEEISDF